LLIVVAVIAATASLQGTSSPPSMTQGIPRALDRPVFPSPAAALAPRIFGHTNPAPHISSSKLSDSLETTINASPNWSGYVLTPAPSDPITDIAGEWTVPSVSLSWAPTYSSAWVGIGGGVQGDQSLAQTGTEQDSFYGFTSVSSWWSTAAQGFLAQGITEDDENLPFDAEPGDVMLAKVAQLTGEVVFQLEDVTTDQTKTIETNYQGTGITGEWILEAPSAVDTSGDFSVLPLAHYGSTVFDNLSLGNVPDSADLTTDEELAMEQNKVVVSVPSAPNAAGDAFAVAYGSTQPAPPSGETSVAEGLEDRSAPKIPVTPPSEFSILDGRFDSP
jgi:hypothetical protein